MLNFFFFFIAVVTLTDIVDGHNLDKDSLWSQLFNYFVQRNRVIVYPQKNIKHNLKSQEMLNTMTIFLYQQ